MHTGGNNWHMWGFSHYIQQFHSEIYCDINISINTMHVRYAARNAGSSDAVMCLTISSLAVSHDSQGNLLFFCYYALSDFFTAVLIHWRAFFHFYFPPLATAQGQTVLPGPMRTIVMFKDSSLNSALLVSRVWELTSSQSLPIVTGGLQVISLALP